MSTAPSSASVQTEESALEVSRSGGALPKRMQSSANGMSSIAVDNQYFYEDEVFRIDRNGRVKFGLIVETSDAYSGDEDEFEDKLLKGEVRVAWYTDGKEDVHNGEMIGLADRTLMPGDVVRRLVPGKDTQRGYCREIKMSADVKVLGTKHVIKGVRAERLQIVGDWQRDSAVCLDSWVGSTKDIEEKAVLCAPSGTRIEVASSEFYAFKDSRSRGMLYPQAFYPGNTVIGRLPFVENVKLLTPDIPLQKNKKGEPVSTRFTIESVKTEAVWVHWQCKALSMNDNFGSIALQQPNPCVSGENLKRLKRLNLFEPCMLQMNDRNFMKYSTEDVVIKKSQWDREQADKFKVILSQQRKENQKNTGQPATTTTTAGSGGGLHHYEKPKKLKLAHFDSDKTKSKKCVLKVDKYSNASKKDNAMNQENIENVPSTISVRPDLACQMNVKSRDNEDIVDAINSAQLSEEEGKSTPTTMSTCSSPSPRNSPKYINRRQLKRKTSQQLKKSLVTPSPNYIPQDGDELITEALLVHSMATVVWQDGSIERGIPSTELYPIHHLDNHEFFPGDFVVSAKIGTDVSIREYGVIQNVDHHGRTARVKWFTTYLSPDDPNPTLKEESEVSVYDLKDHPDFQYRPGTMVIRVANFVGEDATSTAGQIIDNYIDGRVQVWWVDGHVSMCWPQDLFEVGQFDHGDWSHDSEDSWETESENSEMGGDVSPKITFTESNVLPNIQRARLAIARLEEIFCVMPDLQTSEVMEKLLGIYKVCRYMDRWASTTFFHEDHFKGIIQRVLKLNLQDQKTSSINDAQTSQNSKGQQTDQVPSCHYQAVMSMSTLKNVTVSQLQSQNTSPRGCVLFNVSTQPLKCTPFNSASSSYPNNDNVINYRSKYFPSSGRLCVTMSETSTETPTKTTSSTNATSPKIPIPTDYNAEKEQLLNAAIVNIEKVYEKANQLKSSSPSSSQDDSGNFSRTENCDGSSSDLAINEANGSISGANDAKKSLSSTSIELSENAPSELSCVRFCALLKEQLTKCISLMHKIRIEVDYENLNEVFVSVQEEEASEELATIQSLRKALEMVDPLELPLVPKSKVEEEEDVPEDATTKEAVNSSLNTSTSSLGSVPSASECFYVLPAAPVIHKYYSSTIQPTNAGKYNRAVQREHHMLKSSLPAGVWVIAYEDRLDLLSVMMEGPKKTPYEDGLFFFDIQLVRDYPKSPPVCHYISYCSDRLNPNLYEDGKVCVSLLGTWSGRDSEVWSSKSTLLQVIVSIQGLILVDEPYFNEAGYEKQKGTQQGRENSRMYNEMVMIKMVQATTKLLQQPVVLFRDNILQHYTRNGMAMYERIRGWMELSKRVPETAGCSNAPVEFYALPEFPLVPASRGFCLTLDGLLKTFKSQLEALDSERKIELNPE